MSEFTAAMATDKDWYWISADGKRVFSSKRCAVVGADDTNYRAWLDAMARHAILIPKGTLDEDGQPEFMAVSRGATPWPRDEAGQDSDAELDAVLLLYGLSLAGPVRLATGYELLTALTDAQRDLYPTAVKGWDQRRLSLRGADHIPENNPMIARVAPLLKTSPAAWFDAALNPAAS